jgi:hypothetical protein
MWRSLEVQERYVRLLPPGSFRQGEETPADEILHEEHPLLEAAVRWVRTTRFRRDDDHRLSYVVVPDLAEPEVVATFLVTLQDGTATKIERFEAVRVTPALVASRDAIADEDASRSTYPGNVAISRLQTLFGSWWQQARITAELEAQRRATSWREELGVFRALDRNLQIPEIDRWDQATRKAILGDYERQSQQAVLFGGRLALPPAVRRRLDEHRKRVELQRSTLDKRARFEDPVVEPLGILLRVPAALAGEDR